MIALPAGTRVWLAAGTTDQRKGMDGLAALAQTTEGANMYLRASHELGETVSCIAETVSGQPHGGGLGAFGDTPSIESLTDRFQYVEVELAPRREGGRIVTTIKRKGAMSDEKRRKFIKRFLAPMRKYALSRGLLSKLNGDSHTVEIAWGNVGITGTMALNRAGAKDGTGSNVLIVIDESARDWQSMPTIVANPDVGLFHELVHARCTQRGTVVDDEEEMERRVIGLGKYLKAPCTENAYRETRNLDRRASWKKEKL